MPPRKSAATSVEAQDEAASVEAQTGDGARRAEEVSHAQEAFDAMAGEVDIAGSPSERVVKEMTAHVVGLFKHRPKPWSQLSKLEQQDLIRGVEANCHEIVRQVVEIVAANGADPVRCLFVGFADKGDDIKAELKLKAADSAETERAVLFFHRARGHNVLVQLASATEYHRENADDTSEPDQNPLEFDAGTDEQPPQDDSDLVEAAAEPAAEIARTGDAIHIQGSGDCEIEVNLSTGMIEATPRNGDAIADRIDVREATPEELAAERERKADFVEA